MKSNLFLLFYLLFAWIGEASAETITAKDCKLKFTTKGQPVLVNIEGSAKSPCQGRMVIANNKVTESEFKLDLNALDTGIALRDKHLRENYLHTEKFPTAIFAFTDVSNLKTQLKGNSSSKSKFAGTLDLHGVKKPVTDPEYQVIGKNAKAEFTVDFPEFGIERPSFMGVKIVDKVYITVEFEIESSK